jgi:hypothetical protein
MLGMPKYLNISVYLKIPPSIHTHSYTISRISRLKNEKESKNRINKEARTVKIEWNKNKK